MSFTIEHYPAPWTGTWRRYRVPLYAVRHEYDMGSGVTAVEIHWTFEPTRHDAWRDRWRLAYTTRRRSDA